MRLTSALYMRQLLAKLHPPLPKTAKESQRLLNVLESSFRKHLDEIHPSPNAQKDVSDLSNRNIPLSPINSSNFTLHHLNSVLLHPLLDKHVDGDIEKQTAVDRFERALAEGQITIESLLSYVKQYSATIRNGQRIPETQLLSPRIASWLYSAPTKSKESFFRTADLVNRLVPVMAADGQESTVWDWLRMVYERDFGTTADYQAPALTDTKWLQVEDNLVSSLMRLSIRRKELADAAQQFIKACQYRSMSGRASVNYTIKSRELDYVPMLSSWKRLSASIIHIRTNHGIPTDLFESLLQFSVPWSRAPQYSEPILNIYHPSLPSAEMLCRKLRNAGSAAIFLETQQEPSKATRRAMLTSLLDGAQLSLDQNLKHDAKHLLDFASTHYPEYLPSLAKDQHKSIEEYLESVQSVYKAQTSVPHHLRVT